MYEKPGGHRLARGGRIARRSTRVLVGAGAAIALTLPGAGVVGADSEVAAGALVVSATANLPAFPATDAVGTVSGTGTAVVETVDVTTRTAVRAVFELSPYSSAFTYFEGCGGIFAARPVIPPEGNEVGSFDLGPGTLSGGASGAGFLTGNVGWIREGLTLVVLTWNNQLHSGSPTGPIIGPAVLGAGAGILVPIGVPGTCTTVPGSPATFRMASVTAEGG